MRMDKTTLGAIALIVGVAILFQSLFADGIGIGGNPDFGYNQLIGTVVGGVLAAGGLFLIIKSK
jgi:hypothetical protein